VGFPTTEKDFDRGQFSTYVFQWRSAAEPHRQAHLISRHSPGVFEAMISLSLPILSFPDSADGEETELALPTNSVQRQVWTLLAGLYPRGQLRERRFEQRFPYPHLLYLTPLTEDGLHPRDESIVVVGKDLSESGLSFFHQRPLADRRMIVSLESQGAQWVSFLIDLTWCRFTQHGWYFSGGRFLEPRPSPLPGR
jgi:hypothetical protein